MELKTMDDLIATAASKTKKRMALVAAHDEHSLEAIKMAMEKDIIDPILIGNQTKIEALLQQIGGFGTVTIYHLSEESEMAALAVAMVKSGEIDFMMKGKINSSDLLRPVVRKEGLGIGNTISHLTIMSLPGYHKLLGLTDCAMNIQPNLEQKASIVKNAVHTFQKMGYQQPKVALLCANEVVTEKQPDTVEARAIQEMAEQGAFGECLVSGPISFDIAMDAQAAAYKGFNSKVAGTPDILVVPNLVAGNVLNKALKQFGHSVACGTVVGAKCPVVLTSRTTSTQNKFLSIVFSASMV